MTVSVAAVPAFGQTDPGDGSATAGPVTVTPSGKFTAQGSGTLDVNAGTVNCDARASGTVQEDGTGNTTLAFTNCTGAGFVTCTVTSVKFTFSITTAQGKYTAGASVTAQVTCDAGGPDCRITAAGITGTVDDGDEPTIHLDATNVTQDGAATDCDGSVTGNADVTDNASVATGVTGTTTGNELTITK